MIIGYDLTMEKVFLNTIIPIEYTGSQANFFIPLCSCVATLEMC